MNDESRPKAALEWLGSPSSVASTDLPTGLMPKPEWENYLEAYMRGYADGIDLGRRQMSDELAIIQRTAADVVHRMAGLPSRDHQADTESAQRREARWRR